MPDRFDDELARLREAWRGAEPSTGRGEELEREDAATRASVEWLRDAWRSVEPPARPVPLARGLRPRLRLLPRLAAAALVAAGLAALLLRVLEEPDPSAPDAPGTPGAPSEVARVTPPSPPTTGGPRVEAVGPDRIVLRSGSVRLYLPTADAEDGDPEPLETDR